MTAKERLHQLVEELPEEDVPAAQRLLEDLCARRDPVLRALLTAPEEPATPEELEAIQEAEARIAAGERLIPHEEVRREVFGPSRRSRRPR